MTSKEYIVSEIQRVAHDIGRAPGRQLFERETAIRMPEWYGVYWRSWGEALKEAGLAPNSRNTKLSSEYVLRRYAEAVRHFGRVPADIDIRMYSRNRPDFPGHSTFNNHFGSKPALLQALTAFVRDEEEFRDLMELLPECSEPDRKPSAGIAADGFVYLLKSGDFYKIGRSEQLEQRVKQISVALPESASLEHAIKTDDPAGIEAYWHRRFADRRANGEWFKLSKDDIRAFKRRKYQ